MDIAPADSESVLESVARLPIETWRYKSEPDAQHLGPMAQDFAAEFGLGNDDRTIHDVDASGVALAAIQALHDRVERLARENDQLKKRVRALEQRKAVSTTRNVR
jgi:hypothetical protein